MLMDNVKSYLSNDFWKVNAGHVISVSILLGVYLYTSGKDRASFDGKLNSIVAAQAEMVAWKTTVDSRLGVLDQAGTTGSNHKIDILSQTTLFHEQRILKLEDAVKDVAVIRTGVESMKQDFHDFKLTNQRR